MRKKRDYTTLVGIIFLIGIVCSNPIFAGNGYDDPELLKDLATGGNVAEFADTLIGGNYDPNQVIEVINTMSPENKEELFSINSELVDRYPAAFSEFMSSEAENQAMYTYEPGTEYQGQDADGNAQFPHVSHSTVQTQSGETTEIKEAIDGKMGIGLDAEGNPVPTFQFQSVQYAQVPQAGATIINGEDVSFDGKTLSIGHADSIKQQEAVATNVDNYEGKNANDFEMQRANQVIVGSIIFSDVCPVSEFSVEGRNLLKAKVVSCKDNNIFRLPVSQPGAPSTMFVYANSSDSFKVDYTDGTKIWVSRGVIVNITNNGYPIIQFKGEGNWLTIRNNSYEIDGGELSYNTHIIKEKITGKANANIDLVLGSTLLSMRPEARFTHDDMRDKEKSFGVSIPKHGNEYQLFLKKNNEEMDWDRQDSGIIDLVSNRVVLNSIVTYDRYRRPNKEETELEYAQLNIFMREMSEGKNIDSRVDLTADGKNIKKVNFSNPNDEQGELSVYHNGYHTIIEKAFTRLLRINWDLVYPDRSQGYVSNHAPVIEFSDTTLTQNGTGLLTVFSPEQRPMFDFIASKLKLKSYSEWRNLPR